MPIGTGMGPEVATSPQERVGVAAYACMGVYTTLPLEIVPGELTLWL
ncbi:MAG: hypothetical protein HYZ24_14695 [Chloroflexi bacterium]|nr:hypothetical protein [Chloroflexota bacterium]